MLKKLLKYEFKATGRVYGGLYLAILAVAVLMGVSFQIPALLVHTAPIAVLMLVYMGLGVAIAVMTVLSIIQRFTRNLLGREGYLMHTLPVSNAQLILAKLIPSIVWVLCSIVVVLLSFVLFSLFGTLNSAAVSEFFHAFSRYGSEIGKLQLINVMQCELCHQGLRRYAGAHGAGMAGFPHLLHPVHLHGLHDRPLVQKIFRSGEHCSLCGAERAAEPAAEPAAL